MSNPSQFQDWPESLNVPYGPYRAVIERVVDGDTVHVIASMQERVLVLVSLELADDS